MWILVSWDFEEIDYRIAVRLSLISTGLEHEHNACRLARSWSIAETWKSWFEHSVLGVGRATSSL
jgi:hypothetical protein